MGNRVTDRMNAKLGIYLGGVGGINEEAWWNFEFVKGSSDARAANKFSTLTTDEILKGIAGEPSPYKTGFLDKYKFKL